MNKNEYIARYGMEAYEKKIKRSAEHNREWRETNPDGVRRREQKYRETHQKVRKVGHQRYNQKGAIYYKKHLEYERSFLRGDRNRIRSGHRRLYGAFKKIIDPEGLSQIHHEWIPGSADFRGVALVEADCHMHGVIDPIAILEGNITLLTEGEIRTGGNYDQIY